MTDEARVSLVIVSRGRPVELRRVLTSLRFVQYSNFEVIVVARDDPKILFPDVFNIDRVKFVPFDVANISAARNLGISHSSGQIVAFCDDDAVPEPTWLCHLTAPFKDKEVGAAGGYVRGRNGISFQWKGRSFDSAGDHTELEIDGDAPITFVGTSEFGIKTEGTNCAFRKQALLDIDGFDEHFRYYLDETDVNMRLGMAHWKTAIVPLAQVHHGFAASAYRGQNRAPKSLYDIGYSKAWFLIKHTQSQDVTTRLESFTQAQRIRLLEFMVRGDLEPRDVPRLMAELASGIKDGMAAKPRSDKEPNALLDTEFQNFRDQNQLELIAITCRDHRWRKTYRAAHAKAQNGKSVSVFRLSLSSIYHRIEFHKDGFWVHRGGIFGRANRSDRLFQPNTLKSRVKKELARLRNIRPIVKTYSIRDLP